MNGSEQLAQISEQRPIAASLVFLNLAGLYLEPILYTPLRICSSSEYFDQTAPDISNAYALTCLPRPEISRSTVSFIMQLKLPSALEIRSVMLSGFL